MSTLTAGATMRVLPPRTYAANTREAQRWLVAGTAHPAKMHPYLARDLFLRYTQLGQTVLDPFFGRGTSLLGCTLGRNVIGVELEPPFCQYARDNWRHLRANSLPLPGVPLGWALVLRGDSRRLPLRSADSVLTSPPYADAISRTTGGGSREDWADLRAERLRSIGLHDKAESLLRKNATAAGNLRQVDYGASPGQIGALPHGDVSACLSSPPYADLASRDRATEANQERAIARYGTRYGHGDPARHVDGYGGSPGQIGNLPAAAITSPPYAGALATHEDDGGARRRERIAAAGLSGPSAQRGMVYQLLQETDAANVLAGSAGYSRNPANIGDQETEDYASACLAVYRECYRVCRPGGVLVLVTGNYVRAGAIVDLAADTIALAQAAGWTPWERWEHRKSQVSFWRILHHSQGRPIVAHEDVLVFVKGARPGWDFVELEPTNRAPLDLEREAAEQGAQQAALPLEWEAAG